MKKSILFFAMIFTMFIALSGCQKAPEQEEQQVTAEEKPVVYTTAFAVSDFARKIGGDHIVVESLLPPGGEPHGWEPGTEEMNKLHEGKVLIVNGAGLESWTEKVLDAVDNKDLLVVDSSQGVELMEGHSHDHEGEEAHDHEGEEAHDHEGEEAHDHEGEDHDHDHEGIDPHIWLSPQRAKQQGLNILEGLKKAYPEYAEDFEKNYTAFSEEMDKLNKEFEEGLQGKTLDTFAVTHEAFGYLAADYGLKQLGIEGVQSHGEPDPKTMAAIVEEVKASKIPVIFYEDGMNPGIAQTVADEAGVETGTLYNLEQVSPEDQQAGADYFFLMRVNLKALQYALIR